LPELPRLPKIAVSCRIRKQFLQLPDFGNFSNFPSAVLEMWGRPQPHFSANPYIMDTVPIISLEISKHDQVFAERQ
jgi:hypothetical protein